MSVRWSCFVLFCYNICLLCWKASYISLVSVWLIYEISESSTSNQRSFRAFCWCRGFALCIVLEANKFRPRIVECIIACDPLISACDYTDPYVYFLYLIRCLCALIMSRTVKLIFFVWKLQVWAICLHKARGDSDNSRSRTSGHYLRATYQLRPLCMVAFQRVGGLLWVIRFEFSLD